MRRRRGQELEGVNLLAVTPVRLATWDEVGERVVVHRPRPRRRGLGGLLARLLSFLSTPRIRLDAVGSFTWQKLDGHNSVAEVARFARQRFGDDVEPAEERIGRFIRLLHAEELLAYRGYDALSEEEIVSAPASIRTESAEKGAPPDGQA